MYLADDAPSSSGPTLYRRVSAHASRLPLLLAHLIAKALHLAATVHTAVVESGTLIRNPPISSIKVVAHVC